MSYQEALIRKRRLGIPDDAEEFVKEPVFEADQVVGFNANPAQVRPRIAGPTLHAQMMPPPVEQTQLQTRPRIANPRRAAALAALDGDGSVLDDAATTDRIPDRPYIDPASANQPADSRERTVTYDRITGRPNDDFYRDRGDATGLHRAYQNWEPRGAKRGWKNSLKSALMMGAEAARNNPNDPMTAGIAGLAIGLAGGTAAPNFKNRLLRNWKLAQTGAEAKNALGLQKAQTDIEQDEMVPITLDNGQQIMVRRRDAASIQSRQQEIGLRGDTLAARKRRWDTLSANERRREIGALYRAGGLNSPEGLEYAARELDIPVELMPKFMSGLMKREIDENGNIILVNQQTGDVTSTGEQSFEATKEAGRDTRSQEGIQSRERIAATRPSRTTGARTPTPDRATARKAAQLIGTIQRAINEISSAEQRGDAKARDEARLIGEQAAAELNALNAGYEAGPGAGGYPYYKKIESAPSAATSSSTGGKWSLSKWARANGVKDAARLNAARQAAKDAGYTVVD